MKKQQQKFTTGCPADDMPEEFTQSDTITFLYYHGKRQVTFFKNTLDKIIQFIIFQAFRVEF